MRAGFLLCMVCVVACGRDNTDSVTPRYNTLQWLSSVSRTTRDAYFGVAFDHDNRVLATGYVAAGVDSNADHALLLTRFLKDGTSDKTFGNNGVVVLNVRVAGKGQEVARAVGVQSTGKIIVAATIEHDPLAAGVASTDRDLVLVRFNDNGTKDTSFGTNGMLVLDLSTGVAANETATSVANADSVYAMEILADDRILLHGSMRALKGLEPTRTDTDFALVRVTAEGALDASFGNQGVFALDIDQKDGTPKHIFVQQDGSIVASGYAKTSLSNNKTQPVMYKVTSAGVLDTAFGTQGVFHQTVLAEATEVYDFAPQGNSFVTLGYGRALDSESLDWVSLNISASGVLNTAWGNAGALRIDAAGFNDNGRACVALPDNHVFMVGGGRTSETTSDAMLVAMDDKGGFDLDFGTNGRFMKDLGGDEDMLWDVAVSSDNRLVAAVGVRGIKADTVENNDDAVLMLLPLGADF